MPKQPQEYQLEHQLDFNINHTIEAENFAKQKKQQEKKKLILDIKAFLFTGKFLSIVALVVASQALPPLITHARLGALSLQRSLAINTVCNEYRNFDFNAGRYIDFYGFNHQFCSTNYIADPNVDSVAKLMLPFSHKYIDPIASKKINNPAGPDSEAPAMARKIMADINNLRDIENDYHQIENNPFFW